MVDNSTINEKLRNGILIHIFISSILGLMINFPILVVLAKRLRKPSHIDIKLCTIVAVCDILVCFCLLFRSIFTKFPYNILEKHSNWCKFDLLTGSMLSVYSGYLLAIMSFERFLLVCYNIQLSIYIWLSILGASTIPQYVAACLSAYYNLAIIVKIKIYCTQLPKGPGYSVYLIITIMFIISVIVVLISYTGIMVVKYKQCLNQLNLNVPKDQVYRECRITLFKSFLYIILYLLIFSGKIYSLAFEMITGQKRTILMDTIATCLIVCSPFINAVILLYMNQEVRKSLFELFAKLKITRINT
jgi:hypothetical protein